MIKGKKKFFKQWLKSTIYAIVIITCSLILEYATQVVGNQRSAENTAAILLDHVICMLETNEKEEQHLIDSLKEDYIVRAKAAAYMVDQKKSKTIRAEEYKKMMEILSVDEIHLFDRNGVLYDGSIPRYYGLTLDSGEEIGYFKPMLDHRSLSMCQDINLSTTEMNNKMYAMTWNETGTRMIQVGIASKRLMAELQQSEVDLVINTLPAHEGYECIIADKETKEIYGSTDISQIGKTLGEEGFIPATSCSEKPVFQVTKVNGEKIYSTFCEQGDYLVCISFRGSIYATNILMSVIVVFVFLLIAASIIITMLTRLFKVNSERDDQYEILETIAGIYHSMHHIDIERNQIIEYSAKGAIAEIGHRFSGNDARKVVAEIVQGTINPEYLEKAMAFVNMDTLPERMQDKKTISVDLHGKNVGWVRLSYIALDVNKNGMPRKVIGTTQVIDTEKKKEARLVMESNTDSLTGCYNRRAYEDDLNTNPDIPTESDFVYISMDVNGLKAVNDTLGHVAGDEMLRGGAACILRCFGSYGRVYRTGGDEFAVIIYANENRLIELKADFEDAISKWSGEFVKDLAISAGYVTQKEYPGITVREMAKIADQKMYSDKEKYYRNKGLDRRRQLAAHTALFNLYNKILKIDLKNDSYQIISLSETEAYTKVGMGDTYSAHMANFAKEGWIHEDDVEGFLKHTSIPFLQNFFKDGQKDFGIYYRRRQGDRYVQAIMEFVPTGEYSQEEQSLFLYVRIIDKQHKQKPQIKI